MNKINECKFSDEFPRPFWHVLCAHFLHVYISTANIFLSAIFQISAENLPENKPRYVMGVGHQVRTQSCGSQMEG